jgi:hypothetical protein
MAMVKALVLNSCFIIRLNLIFENEFKFELNFKDGTL